MPTSAPTWEPRTTQIPSHSRQDPLFFDFPAQSQNSTLRIFSFFIPYNGTKVLFFCAIRQFSRLKFYIVFTFHKVNMHNLSPQNCRILLTFLQYRLYYVITSRRTDNIAYIQWGSARKSFMPAVKRPTFLSKLTNVSGQYWQILKTLV